MTARKQKRFISYIQLKPHSDPVITFIVIVLMLFGTIMITSTNAGETTTSMTGFFIDFVKQILFVVLGYLLMDFFSKIFHFKLFSSWNNVLLFALIVAMIMPFGFAESGGSHAWIRFPGGLSIQPAEFVKPYMILCTANACYRAKKEKGMLKNGMTFYRNPLLAMFVFGILIAAQKDLGTLTIVLLTFIVCIMIPAYPSIKKFQNWVLLLTILFVAAAVFLFVITDTGTTLLSHLGLSHVATRIANAKNPYNDIYGEGYQPANSLYGIGSANIVGKGIGGSARKYGYLTQANNDYILAIVIEETGIIGFSIITAGYAILIWRLFHYAFRTNEVTYKVVLTGAATYIFIHFALNVGGVTALIPFTGVPLLFISSGGSSLLAVCITLGICQSCISRIRTKEMR